MKKLTRAQAMGLDDETAAKIDSMTASLRAAGIEVFSLDLVSMLKTEPSIEEIMNLKVQVRPPPPVRMTRAYGSILENYEKLSNPD